MRALFFIWVIQGFAAFNLTWGIPAINLDTNPASGHTDVNSMVAIDPSGNAVATWGRTEGKGKTEGIWAAGYNHSSRTWAGAIKISGGGSAANSQVVMDEAGNATIVWEEGFPTQIMFRTLSASGVWSPPLSAPPMHVQESVNAQTFPQITVDSSGNAVCIWMEFSDRIEHIFSAKKPFGLGWINLGKLTAGKNTALLRPKALTMNGSGNAVAVWQEANQTNMEVHGALYKNGAWLPSFTIAAMKGVNCQTPAAGIDSKGNAVIVWNQGDVVTSKTIINGVLSTNQMDVSNATYISKRPDIGVDAKGNAVVVFERYDSMHKFICGTTLPFKGTSWAPQTDISGPSLMFAAGAGYPVFSLNAIGDGVVVWKEYNGTNMIIQGAGFSLGTWSFIKTLSKLDVDAGAPYPAYDIDVSVNLAGNIIAIWPEDPSKNGSQQIKATSGVGLANAAPLPPVIDSTCLKAGIATGEQVYHRFPAHGDLINILTWTAPSGVDHYKIYRKTLLNGKEEDILIGTSTDPRFEDHQRTFKKKETYLISSVDTNGQESCPITLVVQPQ